MKAIASRYSSKCSEIFADFPAVQSYVLFSHGTLIIFDKYEENIEMKAKVILKKFWMEMNTEQVNILTFQDGLTIIGWSDQVLTMILTNSEKEKVK